MKKNDLKVTVDEEGRSEACSISACSISACSISNMTTEALKKSMEEDRARISELESSILKLEAEQKVLKKEAGRLDGLTTHVQNLEGAFTLVAKSRGKSEEYCTSTLKKCGRHYTDLGVGTVYRLLQENKLSDAVDALLVHLRTHVANLEKVYMVEARSGGTLGVCGAHYEVFSSDDEEDEEGEEDEEDEEDEEGEEGEPPSKRSRRDYLSKITRFIH
jgi:hypothetical protein